MFGKLLGGLFEGAGAKMKRMENKNQLEALLGGCLLLAYADGQREDAEIERIEKLVRANDNLSHFGSEITSIINRFCALLDADYQVGKLKIMKEIGEIKNRQEDANEVFAYCLAIAKADGEIEPPEVQELKSLARLLNVNPADYGVQL